MGRIASADQTGAFEALGEVLLQEDVHEQDGQNGDQAACLHPHDLFSGADICVIEQLLGQQGAQVFQHQRNGLVLGEESGADIVVVPVPHHREQKDRQERGGCVGDHDLYEGAERTAAVQISSVLQLLGESLEELAEDEEHESGTDAVAHGCRQVHAELGVDKVDLQPEQSEVPEQHVLGNGDDLGRHEDHHDHDAEEQTLALELKAGEAVACQCAGGDLYQRTADVQQESRPQRSPDVHDTGGLLDDLQRQVAGDPHDRGVAHIGGIPECAADHIDQGIEDDKAQTEQNEESEERPDRFENPLTAYVGDLGFVHAPHADSACLTFTHAVSHFGVILGGRYGCCTLDIFHVCHLLIRLRNTRTC